MPIPKAIQPFPFLEVSLPDTSVIIYEETWEARLNNAEPMAEYSITRDHSPPHEMKQTQR